MMMNNIVMCHPEGRMNEARLVKLQSSGHPFFKSSHNSTSQGTNIDYSVPSDTHMFWETSSTENELEEKLSFVLVGHKSPPNVAKYCDKIKRVVFFGHICRVETTMEIVFQLKKCESVEFILGTKEQLPIYFSDPFTENAESFVNRSVKMVCVKSSCSQLKTSSSLDSTPDHEKKQKIVLDQLSAILKVGPVLWPSVTRLSLELPDDGAYLDLVKANLPMWKLVSPTHSIQIKSSKIVLECKSRWSPKKDGGSSPQKEAPPSTSIVIVRYSPTTPTNNNPVASTSKQKTVTFATKPETGRNCPKCPLEDARINAGAATPPKSESSQSSYESLRPVLLKTPKKEMPKSPQWEPEGSFSVASQSPQQSSSRPSRFGDVKQQIGSSPNPSATFSAPQSLQSVAMEAEEGPSVPDRANPFEIENVAGTIQAVAIAEASSVSSGNWGNLFSLEDLRKFEQNFTRRSSAPMNFPSEQCLKLYNDTFGQRNAVGNSPPIQQGICKAVKSYGEWKEEDNHKYRSCKPERSIVIRGIPNSLEGKQIALRFLQEVFPQWRYDIKNIRVGNKRSSRLLRVPMESTKDVQTVLENFDKIKPYTDNQRTISVEKFKVWMDKKQPADKYTN